MIVIIGGGPAGRLASIRLASEDKEVLLIDKREELGGQCLHKGCMVICALNDIARTIDDCKNLKNLGIFDCDPNIDYSRIIAEMKESQAKIARILDRETRDSGVGVLNAEASVVEKEVIVNDERIKPDNIIIATGSLPLVPDIPGIDLPGVYTPHTITGMNRLPEKITIIGGGVVAAEYAYIFSSYGVKTEIISRSNFLRGKPDQLVNSAKRELKDVDIRENCIVESINGDSKVLGLELIEKGEKRSTDTEVLLIAAGLEPNSGMVTGVAKGERGEIIVDEEMRTDIPGVYAAGDVTGPPFLTPVARFQGITAADSILGKKTGTLPSSIPQSLKLRYEHSFCDTGEKGGKEISIPAPSGPGSFWRVHEGYTGKALVSIDESLEKITGMYLGAPGSGPVSAYMAHLMEKNTKISELSGFLEVHPSTDGIPSIIKYLSQIKGSN